jgi:hypothetical protein
MLVAAMSEQAAMEKYVHDRPFGARGSHLAETACGFIRGGIADQAIYHGRNRRAVPEFAPVRTSLETAAEHAPDISPALSYCHSGD